jgi:hypothetical protein
VVLALLALLEAQLVWPEEAPSSNDTLSGLSPPKRAAFKTVTFQTAANLSDTLVFGTIVGATTTTSILFLVANTASAMAVYFPYELAWDVFGPTSEVTTAKTIAVKTTAYQAITSVRNLALSYLFSGALLPSVGFVAAAIAVDAVIYVANDYAWDMFSPRASPVRMANIHPLPGEH